MRSESTAHAAHVIALQGEPGRRTARAVRAHARHERKRRRHRLPTDGSLIGHDRIVQAQAADTRRGLARRDSIGYSEIQAANPHVDMWLPGQGTRVVIPGRLIIPPVAREGIAVKLAAHRLFYFPRRRPGAPVVITYPVSPGEKGWDTPVGVTRIVRKVPHPVWIPMSSILRAHAKAGDPIARVWPAGPNSPMGEWALETAMSGGEIDIHGTSNPMAIGMAVTHGCVRLSPEDIAALFPIVPLGTPVTIVNDPVLATLQAGQLYLSIHAPAAQPQHAGQARRCADCADHPPGCRQRDRGSRLGTGAPHGEALEPHAGGDRHRGGRGFPACISHAHRRLSAG
jgi:L,D-transpeptidase ErfK/SrfK